MKTIFITLTLLFSLSSFASNTGWNCVVDERDQAEVKKLKLPGYLPNLGILTIPGKSCSVIHIMIYSDVCKVKGHSITVGLNPESSVLRTKAGKHIELMCEVNGQVRPFPAHGGSH